MTLCGWKQYLELDHQAEDQYELVDGTMLSPAGTGNGAHTKVFGGFDKLSGPVRTDGQRGKGLHRQSVMMRLTDSAVLLEESTAPVACEVRSRAGLSFHHPEELLY